MNHAAKQCLESVVRKSSPDLERVEAWSTVLVATSDPAIRSGLSDLFSGFPVNAIWSAGVEAAKSKLAKERIAACFCGFWLQDGTYRELVRHIRRERAEIPVIIVSAPACPDEYRDYLAAMNIGALDFLCHPYRKSELERMLSMSLAMEPEARSVREATDLIGRTLPAGEAA